jgi:hypothetical protein
MGTGYEYISLYLFTSPLRQSSAQLFCHNIIRGAIKGTIYKKKNAMAEEEVQVYTFSSSTWMDGDLNTAIPNRQIGLSK